MGIEPQTVAGFETITGTRRNIIKDRFSRSGFAPIGKNRGGYDIYSLKEGLRIIYANTSSVDHMAEKARLTKAQADKVELEVALAEERQVDLYEVKAAWERLLGSFRSKMLNIPTKMAPVLFGAETGEIQNLLENEIRDALLELVDDTIGTSVGKCEAGAKATAEADN